MAFYAAVVLWIWNILLGAVVAVGRSITSLFSRGGSRTGSIDPLNRADGDLRHLCEYVSRWSLVEFGVECPKCEAVIAAAGEFHKIRKTDDGEAILCGCGRWLLASPTTEKGEHLLPYSRKMQTFARKPHDESPVDGENTDKVRESQGNTAAKRMKLRKAEELQPWELDGVELKSEKASATAETDRIERPDLQ